MTARRLLVPPVAAVACLAAGCVQTVQDGNAATIRYETWVGLLGLAAGVAAVPVGLLVRRHVERLGGWFVTIGLPLLAVLFVPGLFLDHVTVTPDGFSTRWGMWFKPVVHDVRFDDLTQIAVTAEETTGRRGRKNTTYYLNCSRKNGSVAKVSVGDLMRSGGMDRILDRADEKGIPIVDQTGGR